MNTLRTSKSMLCLHIASAPGRPLGEERPGIDCLRMCRIFHILSSNVHGTIIQRVFGEYNMITRF